MPAALDGLGGEGHFRAVVEMTRRTGLTVADRVEEWQEAGQPYPRLRARPAAGRDW